MSPLKVDRSLLLGSAKNASKLKAPGRDLARLTLWTDGQELHLLSSNNELTYEATVAFQGDGELPRVALAAPHFVSVLNGARGEFVTLELDADESRVKVAGDSGGKFNLAYEASTTDPMPFEGDGIRVKVEAVEFVKHFGDASMFACADATRPSLMGVEFRFQEDKREGRLAATDGHRLFMGRMMLAEAPTKSAAILVDGKTGGFLKGIMDDGLVELKFTDTVLVALLDTETVSTRLLSAVFPDVARILKAKSENPAFTALYGSMLDSVKALKTLGTGITFEVPSDEPEALLRVDNQTGILALDGAYRIDIEKVADTIPEKFALNAAYLFDALRVLEGSDRLGVYAKDGLSPIFFMGVGPDAQRVLCVMPMRV